MTEAGLSKLIAEYQRSRTPTVCREQQWYADAPHLGVAITRAAESIGGDGKCHSHQRRVGKETLQRFGQGLLLRRQQIGKCRTFAELHEEVASAKIEGIGQLTIYDTADRIALFKGIAPDAIYLHAGTRAGARALGLRAKGPTLAMGELPAPLRKLSAREIENFLCVFKSRFGAEDPGKESRRGRSCHAPSRHRTTC